MIIIISQNHCFQMTNRSAHFFRPKPKVLQFGFIIRHQVTLLRHFDLTEFDASTAVFTMPTLRNTRGLVLGERLVSHKDLHESYKHPQTAFGILRPTINSFRIYTHAFLSNWEFSGLWVLTAAKSWYFGSSNIHLPTKPLLYILRY